MNRVCPFCEHCWGSRARPERRTEATHSHSRRSRRADGGDGESLRPATVGGVAVDLSGTRLVANDHGRSVVAIDTITPNTDDDRPSTYAEPEP